MISFSRCLFACASVLLITSCLNSLGAADWPQWRNDASRSAATTEPLPEELYLRWWRDYREPEPAWPEDSRLMFDATYEPIVTGNTLLISSAVTDSVTAFDTETGAERWCVYADGPVRFAPVALQGRAYFGADDGHFYCVEVATGELLWKFRAAPRRRLVLGNDRLISMWPLRGAPVLVDGKIFFTIGVWPSEGGFLYEIDTARSEASASYTVTTLPELTPQGYLAAGGGSVFIPGGRAAATRYGLQKRDFESFEYNVRGLTDYHLSVGDKWIFHGQRVFDAERGKVLDFVAPRPVFDRQSGEIYSAAGETVTAVNLAQPKLIDSTDRKGKPIQKETFSSLWEVPGTSILAAANRFEDTRSPRFRRSITGPMAIHVRAGNRLYGNWADVLFAIDLPDQEHGPRVSWSKTIQGAAKTMAVADGKLFVGTGAGRIYCFDGAQKHPRTYSAAKTRPAEYSSAAAERVRDLLAVTGAAAAGGFCLVWGVGNGELIDGILEQSELRVVAIDPDSNKVDGLRRRLTARGLYGRRAAALVGDPASVELPPFLAQLVISEDLDAAGWGRGQLTVQALFRILRPYGGTACLELSASEHTKLAELVQSANLHGAEISRHGMTTVLRRAGELAGTADWDHEFGDSANTLTSRDTLVKAPLGVLWFGGPSSDGELFFDRHKFPPGLAVKHGRMFIQGPRVFTAVDIYTGRILWKIPVPQGLSAGRTGWDGISGFHYVVTEDSLYLSYEKSCVRLDPASGRQLDEFTLDDPNDDWGRIRIVDDFLVVPVFRRVDESIEAGLPIGFRKPRGGHGRLPFKLVAMNRHSGKVVWTQQARQNFLEIAIGKSSVFCFDGRLKDFFRSGDRKGLDPQSDTTHHLKSFDLKTGELRWEKETLMALVWLAYSDEHDVVVGSNKNGVETWSGKSGERLWRRNSIGYGFKGHPESVWNKVVIRKNQVIDQRGPGRFYDLLTGRPIQRAHPITGEIVDLQFTKVGHHCNYAVANEHLLTFRAGTGGFFDLNTSGTGRLKGFRTGCRNSLIPAGGVLNVPNYAHGCSCSFNVFTSLAFVHVPENEQWTYNTFTVTGEPVDRVGINFGAPGDRLAPNGTLWLDHPNIGGPSPKLAVKVAPENARSFRHHASQVSGAGLTWVAASGVEGVTSVVVPLKAAPVPTLEGVQPQDKAVAERLHTVRLYFSEPGGARAGQRVFNVALAGKPVLDHFDVAKEAGGSRHMIVKEFDDISLGGELSISLTATKGEPVLSGVEVVAND